MAPVKRVRHLPRGQRGKRKRLLSSAREGLAKVCQPLILLNEPLFRTGKWDFKCDIEVGEGYFTPLLFHPFPLNGGGGGGVHFPLPFTKQQNDAPLARSLAPSPPSLSQCPPPSLSSLSGGCRRCRGAFADERRGTLETGIPLLAKSHPIKLSNQRSLNWKWNQPGDNQFLFNCRELGCPARERELASRLNFNMGRNRQTDRRRNGMRRPRIKLYLLYVTGDPLFSTLPPSSSHKFFSLNLNFSWI